MSKPNPRESRGSLLREPLVHFLLLGVLVFALDYGMGGSEDPANIISITPKVDQELIDVFAQSRQREPNAEELEALRQRWIDNEVLYREGIAMGLDQGDTAIRERVIFKSLNVVQSGIENPQPDDATLQQWFEVNRARYDEPPRVNFLAAIVQHNPTLEELQAFAASLNKQQDHGIDSSLRVFRGRPHHSIVTVFGEDFADALKHLEPNIWHVVDSKEGPRVILVEAHQDGAPAKFADVQGTVLQDWRDRRMQELRTEAVRKLGENYQIRLPASDQQLASLIHEENVL